MNEVNKAVNIMTFTKNQTDQTIQEVEGFLKRMETFLKNAGYALR